MTFPDSGDLDRGGGWKALIPGRMLVVLLMGFVLALVLFAQAADLARVKRGEDLFGRRCTGCHRLDEIRAGPRLRNVFGRQAGVDAGFPYSEGLKASRFKWDEVTLDKWLTDTEALVPENDMSFRLTTGEERGAIIAYLKMLSVR